jgi:hypothetical protein
MEPRIPVEPIAELIDRVMKAESFHELECEGDQQTITTYQNHGIETPLAIVMHRIFVYPHHSFTFDAIRKKVWSIRSRRYQTTVNGKRVFKKLEDISLEWADLIVCALDSPALFLTDERLREAYTADVLVSA